MLNHKIEYKLLLRGVNMEKGIHLLESYNDGIRSPLCYALITASLPFGRVDYDEESKPMCDALVMCPTLVITLDSAEIYLWERVKSLLNAERKTSKNEQILPLNFNTSNGVVFSIRERELSFHCENPFIKYDSRLEYLFDNMSLSISQRYKYFLSKSKTLAIIILRDNIYYYATVCEERGSKPKVLVHNPVRGSGFQSVIDKSNNWQEVFSPGNIYVTGAQDLPNDHYIAMFSDKEGENITDSVKYNGSCIFGHEGSTTIEHCTPKWLTSILCAKPITCKILCKKCNSDHFGQEYEEQMSRIYAHRKICDPTCRDFVALWCYKTALFISTAANVHLKNEWLEALQQNRISTGFQIFIKDLPTQEKNCYYATVAIFNETRTTKGYYLFQFICDRMCFIVANSPEKIIPEDFCSIPQIYPIPENYSMKTKYPLIRDGQEMFQKVFDYMTGMESEFISTSKFRSAR